MLDLTVGQRLGQESDDLASFAQGRVGDDAHEAHSPAAVDDSVAGTSDRGTELIGHGCESGIADRDSRHRTHRH